MWNYGRRCFNASRGNGWPRCKLIVRNCAPAQQLYMEELRKRYSYVRQFAPRLLETFALRAKIPSKPLREAVAYLRILHFPADVTATLEADKLTLQEAAILARINAERLTTSPHQAKALRQQILTAHLQTNASQNGLRARVQSVLGEEAAPVSSETMARAVQKVDELLEIDPEDKRHLFFEEIRNLFYALREIESEDIDESTLADFSDAADRLFTIIHAIQKKRRRCEKDSRLLSV